MLSEGGHSWAGRAADPAPSVQRAVVQRSKLSHGNVSFTNAPNMGREEENFRGMPHPVPGLEGKDVPDGFAAVYNAYKARLSQNLPLGRQPIKPLFPPDKTPEAVKADFATLLKRITKGKLWAWSIENSD